jgi:hypothetical protein
MMMIDTAGAMLAHYCSTGRRSLSLAQKKNFLESVDGRTKEKSFWRARQRHPALTTKMTARTKRRQQHNKKKKMSTRDYKKLKAIEGNRGYSVVGN